GYASSVFVCAAAPAQICTLSLPDALPISGGAAVICGQLTKRAKGGASGECTGVDRSGLLSRAGRLSRRVAGGDQAGVPEAGDRRDRKSTRLNSSHEKTSYAVFCLKQ